MKNDLVLTLRWSLFLTIIISLFWFVWSLFAPTPEVIMTYELSKIPLCEMASSYLPMSRWWDILLGPIIPFGIFIGLRLMKASGSYKPNTFDDPDDVVTFMVALVFIGGVSIGTLGGFIGGLIFFFPIAIFTAFTIFIVWTAGGVFYVLAKSKTLTKLFQSKNFLLLDRCWGATMGKLLDWLTSK